MKLVHAAPIVVLASCLTLASCGEGGSVDKTVSAATKAASNIDLSKLTPENLVAEAKTIGNDLSQELAKVKDSQGAKDLVAKFQPLIDQLSKLKTTLTAESFDMSTLSKAVTDATAKFTSNPEIMKILQPLIDKIKTLVA